jgi:tripartite-type tricarboxylate transporter receptor subunit TctC
MQRRRTIIGAGATAIAIAAMGAFSSAAMAQATWPNKPVRIIVPFAAGTSPDAVARILAEKLTGAWHQTVLVENRAGAAGIIGAEAAAASAPDGYTLFMPVASVMVINPHVYQTLRYNALSDFTPVTQVLIVPYVLTATPGAPFNNLAELVKVAKEKPGSIDYGSFGVGSQPHVAMEAWAKRLGIKLNHVPYSASPSPDLMSGVLSLLMDPSTTAVPVINANKVKAIAVTSGQRMPSLPNVPAASEYLPGLESVAWHGIFVPKNTPPDVVTKLNTDLVAAIKLPDVQTRLKDFGLIPVGSSAAEFNSVLISEYASWGRSIRELGIKVQ